MACHLLHLSALSPGNCVFLAGRVCFSAFEICTPPAKREESSYIFENKHLPRLTEIALRFRNHVIFTEPGKDCSIPAFPAQPRRPLRALRWLGSRSIPLS
jgi:hypothetical protein